MKETHPILTHSRRYIPTEIIICNLIRHESMARRTAALAGSLLQVFQIRVADWYELFGITTISSYDNTGLGRAIKYVYRDFEFPVMVYAGGLTATRALNEPRRPEMRARSLSSTPVHIFSSSFTKGQHTPTFQWSKLVATISVV
jgi:hypothetical protein